jgi:hypothetical protein
MRKPKLKLNLDEMTVDSFLVDALPSGTGTVNAHYADEYEQEAAIQESYVRKTVLYHTEQISCNGTCASCVTCPCYA